MFVVPYGFCPGSLVPGINQRLFFIAPSYRVSRSITTAAAKATKKRKAAEVEEEEKEDEGEEADEEEEEEKEEASGPTTDELRVKVGRLGLMEEESLRTNLEPR
ncbi:unnamed protein product [Ectocarpus sp. CCAP 1310/34]|nr:unnamed protein product [Ectocarpus sp. CCAP 1310/34]